MTSNLNLESIQVRDVMNLVQFTVSPTQKLDSVANLFQKHNIHSAPVVDVHYKCVGIITGHDLIRYQSELSDLDSRNQGISLEATRRQPDGSIEIIPHTFDEVQRHMTVAVQTIDPAESIQQAAKVMCEQHIHHLVVLDVAGRPSGILSSLDILSKLYN